MREHLIFFYSQSHPITSFTLSTHTILVADTLLFFKYICISLYNIYKFWYWIFGTPFILIIQVAMPELKLCIASMSIAPRLFIDQDPVNYILRAYECSSYPFLVAQVVKALKRWYWAYLINISHTSFIPQLFVSLIIIYSLCLLFC